MTSTSAPSSTWADGRSDPVGAAYRADWGRLLSLLVASTRRLDLAEDALSDAFTQAADRWPTDGVPDDPAAWLYQVARRRIIGAIRSEGIHGRAVQRLTVGAGLGLVSQPVHAEPLGDERLAVILLCSHPALEPAARAALSLRLVIGTPTAEIARLFLVPTPTMAARVTRAKKKIVSAGIPLRLPADDELRLRLDDVCRCIFLAFTAGYSPGTGPDLLRVDLAGEAVELAAVLRDLVPDAAQVNALWCLLTLQHARRDARERDGTLIRLGDQDRTRWRIGEIGRATRQLGAIASANGYTEELRLQALIAAEHGTARHAGDTDWARIALLYRQLDSLTASPVVRMNRAVAVAEAGDAAGGVALLDSVGNTLGSSHRFHAVRASLAERSGDVATAIDALGHAISRCDNDVERAHLANELTRLQQLNA